MRWARLSPTATVTVCRMHRKACGPGGQVLAVGRGTWAALGSRGEWMAGVWKLWREEGRKVQQSLSKCH